VERGLEAIFRSFEFFRFSRKTVIPIALISFLILLNAKMNPMLVHVISRILLVSVYVVIDATNRGSWFKARCRMV
jgi:hypothetical protein